MNSEPKEDEIVRLEVSDQQDCIEILAEVKIDILAEGEELGVNDTFGFTDKLVEAEEPIVSDKDDDELAGSA